MHVWFIRLQKQEKGQSVTFKVRNKNWLWFTGSLAAFSNSKATQTVEQETLPEMGTFQNFIFLFPCMYKLRNGATGKPYRKHEFYKTAKNRTEKANRVHDQKNKHWISNCYFITEEPGRLVKNKIKHPSILIGEKAKIWWLQLIATWWERHDEPLFSLQDSGFSHSGHLWKKKTSLMTCPKKYALKFFFYVLYYEN